MVESFEYNYNKISLLKDYFLKDKNNKNISFNQVKVVCCQHLLDYQFVMIKSFIDLGILPRNIYVLGKVYSTNSEVLNDLNNIGINVIQPKYDPFKSFDKQHKNNCEDLFNMINLGFDDKLFILDDGGQLIETFNSKYIKNIIGAVEQTSSGFRKLEEVELNFPVFNVARSQIKLEYESSLIANHAYSRIKNYIDNDLKDQRILVVGLGPIGLEMIKCIKSDNKVVIGYDKVDGEKNIVNLIKNNNINVVIGATGAEIITHAQIIELSNVADYNICLVSVSSSDREFEVWKLRDLFDPDTELHSNIKYKNITILNNGFPISFKGNRVELSNDKIENTICLLFGSVMYQILNDVGQVGWVDIPENLNNMIKINERL